VFIRLDLWLILGMKIRVLFVCMGNICRSPMAEAVFNHMVRAADLEERIEADSAGTDDWHTGSAAHAGTLEILQHNGIAYDGRGRQIRAADLNDFDYIVTMDDDNLRGVQQLGQGRAVVRPLLEYAAEESGARLNSIRQVPDPYYDGRFDTTYDLVGEGCRGLLDAIRREHAL
jgi:protein-tyrosine phosphatase